MAPLELLAPMLVSIAVAVLLLLLAGGVALWKREPGRRTAKWLAPAAAFTAGAYLVRGLPSLPPADAAGWIFWSVGVAAITGCCVSTSSRWLLWGGRGLAVVGMVYLIARPLIGRVWEGADAAVWFGGFALIFLGVWAAGVQGHRDARVWRPLLLWLLSTIGLGVLLMVAGTASYSLYALALAGVIAGAGAASLSWARRFGPDPRPAAAILVLPWAGLLIAGHLYADVPLSALLLTASSPFAVLLPRLPKMKALRTSRMVALQIGWAVLPLAIAAVVAHVNVSQYGY